MAENHVEMDGEECFDEDDDETSEQEETLLYFGGLFRREERDRLQFIANFSKCVKAWIAKPDDLSAQSMLKAHLPTALRLSTNAPFRDIRENFIKLLKEIKELGYDVPTVAFPGPSSFIPLVESVGYERDGLQGMKSSLEQVQSHYENAFMCNGRLSNMVQVMGYHPSYLAMFLKSDDFLMHGNGPLPLHVRNYVAILAASRHKCSYLVTVQEAEFLKNHGDKQWLKGIQYVPRKLQNLLHINKVLAHQPWYVRTEHIKELLVGADSWSMSELVHALTIMAHYHSLAGFCLGCGINPEIDTPLGHTTSSRSNEVHSLQGYYTNPALGIGAATPSDSESETVSPVLRSPTGRSPTHPGMAKSLVQHFIESTCCDQEDGDCPNKMLSQSLRETLITMQTEGSSSDEDSDEQNRIMFEKTASSAGMEADKPNKFPIPTPINLVKYIEDPDYEHEDFTLSAAVTLRAREYSWEDHGYPFLSSLYPDIGPLLDEKFNMALQMTYRQIGSETNIDTGPFREATWYYIHSIKGIRHDDYHYRRVNQLLDITFKTYIRMVGCFPEKVNAYSFHNCIRGLAYSEKIHVNILVLEARLQAELIYALRAIMNYMK